MPISRLALVAAPLALAQPAFAQCELGAFTSFDFGDDGAVHDEGQFGSTVAASGPVIAVGAPFKDHLGVPNSGAAFVYRHDGTGYQPEQVITSPVPLGGSFGLHVLLDGDRLLIQGGGGLHEYAFDGTTWIHLGLTAVNPSGRFALDGDVLLRADELFDDKEGLVDVYRKGSSGWVLEQTLSNPLVGSVHRFGSDVSVDGDVLAVGATGGGSALGMGLGAAHVYRFGPGGWALEDTLQPGDGELDTLFGTNLSVSGESLVVAATHKDLVTPEFTVAAAGAVYAYRHDGSGAWYEEQVLVPSAVGFVGNTGTSLDLDGDVVGIGSNADAFFSGSGSVAVFRRTGGVWVELPRPEPSTIDFFDDFGSDVAVSGNVVVGSSPLHDVSPLSDVGAVYAFSARAPEGLGGGVPDAGGLVPSLAFVGDACPGQPFAWQLAASTPLAPSILVAGFSTIDLPFGGGTFFPAPDLVVAQSSPVNPSSALFLAGALWPPSAFGLTTTWQAVVLDVAAPSGLALSDAISL